MRLIFVTLCMLLSTMVSAHSDLKNISDYVDELQGDRGDMSDSYIISSMLKGDDYLEYSFLPSLKEILSDFSGVLHEVNTTRYSYYDLKDDAELRKELYTKVEKITFGAYYCSLFVDYNTSDYDKKCAKKTISIVKKLLAAEINEIYLVNIAGDEWGDYRIFSIVAVDSEKNESLTLSFDIVHEI